MTHSQHYPLILLSLLTLYLTSCTYLRTYNEQLDLKEKQQQNPSQKNLKHLLNTENILTHGLLVDLRSSTHTAPLCVLALSNRYSENEIVDTSCDNNPNHFFKLNLPLGHYNLIVIEDENKNMKYQGTEIIASRTLLIDSKNTSNLVLADTDIIITDNKPTQLEGIVLKYQDDGKHIPSLFYTNGFIRNLEDPIFSRSNAIRGFYNISDFIEHVPKMFYALDELHEFRIPVIFVHGINGTPRDFIPMLNTLDRTRFSPYFYYYPSGSPLNQLATYFYNMVLSGYKFQFKHRLPIIIVAHSMGGIVVREALNLYKGDKNENNITLFITLAAPFDGHPGAQLAVDNAPLMIPSWQNIGSDSTFIQNLQRKALPKSMEHHLFFAYKNRKRIKFGENSDGAVPLSSQLEPRAMKNATKIYAYNKTHTSILRDNDAIEQIQALLTGVANPYPVPHREFIEKGGFQIEMNDQFTPKEQYAIKTYGYYLQALGTGYIKPVLKEQREFINNINGSNNLEDLDYITSAWIKFRRYYPQLASGEMVLSK